MIDFAAELREHGYNLANCAKRLGVFPRFGVNFAQAFRCKPWTKKPEDPVDTFLGLFIDGHDIEVERLTAHVSSAFVDNALEMKLLERDGRLLRSKISLFPFYNKFIVTDRAVKNTAINQVMWLWGESYLLGGQVKRTPRRRAIDLGTGSGVHAILASDHCESVVGVDINPRAIEFGRFNTALNGINNIEFTLSDLFNYVDSTCDLLLANPPYAPDDAAAAGENFWSGGPEGTDILRRIVEAIPDRLDPSGACHIIALYPNPPGTTISVHFDHWLAGTLHRYQVLDHTWRVANYRDELSDKPFTGDKSAWRFGVVSLRRASNTTGWWKQAAGSGVFFREDGNCAVIADHDAAASDFAMAV